MTPTCPECGGEIAAVAAICPRCGFPLRPPTYGAPAGRSSRSNVAGIAAAVVMGLFFFVFVVGILAAIAVPRFALASRRAKEQEAELMLRQIYALEQGQLAKEGAYTLELEKLAVPADPAAPWRYYHPGVSRAEGKNLCLEAVPRAGSGVSAFSMDEQRWLYQGAGCIAVDAARPRSSEVTVDTVTSFQAVPVPKP